MRRSVENQEVSQDAIDLRAITNVLAVAWMCLRSGPGLKILAAAGMVGASYFLAGNPFEVNAGGPNPTPTPRVRVVPITPTTISVTSPDGRVTQEVNVFVGGAGNPTEPSAGPTPLPTPTTPKPGPTPLSLEDQAILDALEESKRLAKEEREARIARDNEKTRERIDALRGITPTPKPDMVSTTVDKYNAALDKEREKGRAEGRAAAPTKFVTNTVEIEASRGPLGIDLGSAAAGVGGAVVVLGLGTFFAGRRYHWW